MSDIIFAFDPTTGGQASFPAPNSAANGTLVFWNESNISQIINLNGNDFYLPAWYNRHFTGAAGNVNVLWQVHTVLNSGQVPTSEVIIEAYYEGEEYPPDGPLVRQANGNTNATTVNNTLVNTNNPPLTPDIIEIQPTDATSPTTTLDNSGNFVVKGDNAGVLTTLLQTIGGASPEVILAAASVLTDILGTLSVAGAASFQDDVLLINKKLSHATSGDLIDWTTNTEVFLKAISSGLPARLTVGVGSRSDWTIGSIIAGQANGTSGTVNHNMNIPNIPIIVPIVSQPGSATSGVGNITNTSFEWTIGAGTGIYWFVYGK